jgi:hypothetical protein
MKKFNLDLVKGRIEFLDNRFYSTGDGFVPSVTTILEAYPKDASYFKWLKDVGSDADSIRDEAGRRGSVVHELTEKYDCGEECTFINLHGNPQFKMNEWSMFERYVEFVNLHNPKNWAMELHMASASLGFAGTLDRVIEINGKTMLIDIKTSNSIYPSYWLQLAAYHQLLIQYDSNMGIDAVGILWLNAKTRTMGKNGAVQGIGWQLVTKDMDELKNDWELFQSTHKLWLALNADIKPKQLSYQLTHKKNG